MNGGEWPSSRRLFAENYEDIIAFSASFVSQQSINCSDCTLFFAIERGCKKNFFSVVLLISSFSASAPVSLNRRTHK